MNSSTGSPDRVHLGAKAEGFAQSFTWKLAYKTTSAAKALSPQGWDKDTVRAAFFSCNVHDAAIKYEIDGKPHSYYRRTRGPEKTGVDAWKKGACGQCDGFDPFELIADYWRSKQTNGATNQLGAEKDFEMFSTEAEFFARAPVWSYCDYDDVAHHVGYPRDCGPKGADNCKWHALEGSDPHCGKANVAFYVNTCGSWAEPLGAEVSDGTLSWEFLGLLFLGIILYLLIGSAYNKRYGRIAGVAGVWDLRLLPHRAFWLQFHGLVLDGIEFTRARGGRRRKPDGDGNLDKSLVGSSSRGSVASVAGSEKSERSTKSAKSSKSSKARKKTTSAKKSKSSKKKGSPSSSSSSKKTAVAGAGGTDLPTTGVEGPGWSGNAEGRALGEQHEEHVHSSQAKVKVISLLS